MMTRPGRLKKAFKKFRCAVGPAEVLPGLASDGAASNLRQRTLVRKINDGSATPEELLEAFWIQAS